MLQVSAFADTNFVSAKATIQHPLADEVSMAMGDGAMCIFPYSVELAFFKNGEWVEQMVPEFASHSYGPADGTRVYGHVPLWEFAAFLKDWRVQ